MKMTEIYNHAEVIIRVLEEKTLEGAILWGKVTEDQIETVIDNLRVVLTRYYVKNPRSELDMIISGGVGVGHGALGFLTSQPDQYRTKIYYKITIHPKDPSDTEPKTHMSIDSKILDMDGIQTKLKRLWSVCFESLYVPASKAKGFVEILERKKGDVDYMKSSNIRVDDQEE